MTNFERPALIQGFADIYEDRPSTTIMCAIYHLHTKIFARSKNQNVIAAAAYRSSTTLRCFLNGQRFDYTCKRGTVHTEIIAPGNAPTWVLDRECLWNTVEAKNRRKDAQLCREVEIALPRELSLPQNIALARKFVTEQFIAQGMIADICIHQKVSAMPQETSDGFEYHAHILLTLNTIARNGFGPKNRSWNNREFLLQWRTAWAIAANTALEEVGSDERIDERSLQEQKLEALAEGNFGRARNLDRVPEPKIGVAAFNMNKRGLSVARYRRWLSVKRLNIRRLWQNLTRGIRKQVIREKLNTPNTALGPKSEKRNSMRPEND